MNFKIVKQIRDDDILRGSFIDLANQIFGLSFYNWHKKGFWTDKYIPYAMVCGNKVVSNASVNIMDFIIKGELKRYIQIGTVMTAPEYRNNGMSRTLINEIINDWKEKCSCIYLFANSSVLDFYPKFGFEKAYEYQFSFKAGKSESDFRKLDMSDKNDLEILKQYYITGNPYSVMSSINNFGLLMFYCDSFFKDCIFYSKMNNAVCIAQQTGSGLYCLDVFAKHEDGLGKLLSGLTSNNRQIITLGFTPSDLCGGTLNQLDNADDTLFILKGQENIFKNSKFIFPPLSKA